MPYNLTMKRGSVDDSTHDEPVRNAGLRSDGELVQAVSEQGVDTVIFVGNGDEDWATHDDFAAILPDDPGCSVDDTSVFADDKPIKDTDFSDAMPDDLPAG
ncbi:MAG: hypothetical protein ACWA5T_08500 [Parvularcula sp.]